MDGRRDTTWLRRVGLVGALIVALLGALTPAYAGTSVTRTDGVTRTDRVTQTDGAEPTDVSEPVARTEQGPVVGTREGAVERYRGIPYAAPPIGDLRWEPPRAPKSWTEPRPARRSGPPCAQNDTEGNRLEGSVEDCLYANVTAPVRRTGDPKPVLVWLHGGGNHAGQGAEFDPRRMVERGDVVVVTVNYRLGAFGFFNHPALADSGSFGLLDQQAALRWVRTNAAAFGGDAGNVTVFGESAGGIDICAQLTSPSAAGLFDRAVMQSGTCGTRTPTTALDGSIVTSTENVWAPVGELRERGEEVTDRMGCPASGTPEETRQCLRELPRDALLGQLDGIGIASGTPTLPDPLDAAIRDGRFHRVPVISGTTADEARYTTMFAEFRGEPIDEQKYAELLGELFGDSAEAVAAEYPVAEYDGDPSLAFATMDTDRVFACPQLATNDALSRYVPTYAYEFADRTAPTYGPFFTDMPPGATHASELAYLFDLALGPWGPGLQEQPLNAEQLGLADTMIDYWTSFARTGVPRAGSVDWPAYAAADRPAYVQSMALGAGGIGPVDAATEHRCAFWADLRS